METTKQETGTNDVLETNQVSTYPRNEDGPSKDGKDKKKKASDDDNDLEDDDSSLEDDDLDLDDEEGEDEEEE